MNKKDYLKVLILMIGEFPLIFGVLIFSNIIIDFGEIDYITALILGFGAIGLFFLIKLNIDKILNFLPQKS